jgi:hypothetical protein
MSHAVPRFVFLFLLGGCLVCLNSTYAAGSPRGQGARLYPRCPVAAPPVRQAEWTIMIYLNGDNDLSEEAITDFEEMAKVTYSSKVNVVVQMDLIDGDDTDASWDETRRFFMRKGLKPTRSCSLPGFNEEANMGSLTTLAEFVIWAMKAFPAKRNALIIWDHGDGWRFLDSNFASLSRRALATQRRRAVAAAEDLLSRRSLTKEALNSLRLVQNPLGTQYRAVSEDFTNESDRLFVREIQDALEFLVKGRANLDLIGFDACLMQMIETAYALRRVANVVVGSEELEPDTGWDYGHWLQPLVNNPGMNAAALGKLLVHSYRETYEKTNPATTLSAANISRGNVERLAAAVSSLAQELIVNIDSDLDYIKDARRRSSKYAPARNYHGVDLHRVALLLATSRADPTLRARARDVQLLVEQMVIACYAGSERQGDFGSYGLAIYFPESETAFRDDLFGPGYTQENIFYVVQFVAEQEWDRFLKEYFERVTVLDR